MNFTLRPQGLSSLATWRKPPPTWIYTMFFTDLGRLWYVGFRCFRGFLLFYFCSLFSLLWAVRICSVWPIIKIESDKWKFLIFFFFIYIYLCAAFCNVSKGPVLSAFRIYARKTPNVDTKHIYRVLLASHGVSFWPQTGNDTSEYCKKMNLETRVTEK